MWQRQAELAKFLLINAEKSNKIVLNVSKSPTRGTDNKKAKNYSKTAQERSEKPNSRN